MTIELEVSARRGGGEVRCVFCRDELIGAIETCPGCGATFHPACRAEMARCTTIGCSGVRGAEDSRSRRKSTRQARLAAEPAGTTPPRPVDAVEPPRRRTSRSASWARADDGGFYGARTPQEFLVWGGIGAGAGLTLGLLVAYMASRHGIDLRLALRFGGIGALLGLVEGVVIGAVGVRRQPVLGGRRKNPTTAVQAVLCMPCAFLGAIVADHLHVSPFLGMFAAVLLVIPLLLRWLGFG